MRILFTLMWVVLCSTAAFAQVQVDPKLPEYKPTIGVAGALKTVGSDSMNTLMQKWTERFKQYYRGVQVGVEGQGSSTAMPALIAGTSSFGPMSRDPKASEIEQFEARFGYKPTVLPTAIDLLGVYVHRDNPIESLTLPQVDAIFSQTRKLGGAEQITTWGQLGVQGRLANERISLFGRNSASGTYGFFKDVALGGGDYLQTVNEQAGSATVVSSVGESPAAIGYSGIGYKTAAVKAVPLVGRDGQAISPTPENAYTGDYPLARYLYLAVNAKPNQKMDTLRAEFIKFIYSQQGQQLVVEDGYFPVDAETAQQTLKSLGLSR